jgi:hypothetical protein
MRYVLLTSLLVFASASVAGAQSYSGAGGVSCSDVAAANRALDPTRFTYGQWALGYGSGLTAAWKFTHGADLIARLDPEHLRGFTQRYCAANPSSTLVKAVNEWFVSLPK